MPVLVARRGLTELTHNLATTGNIEIKHETACKGLRVGSRGKPTRMSRSPGDNPYERTHQITHELCIGVRMKVIGRRGDE